jgi:hypothetical protein
MTTQEVANRYYELASQSKWIEIQEELHDDNVISQEPEHAASRGIQVMIKGREAVKAKATANRETIDTIHSQFCSEPVVAGNFFSLGLKRDVTYKGRPRVQLEEICVFQVKEGKIVLEQFFF